MVEWYIVCISIFPASDNSSHTPWNLTATLKWFAYWKSWKASRSSSSIQAGHLLLLSFSSYLRDSSDGSWKGVWGLKMSFLLFYWFEIISVGNSYGKVLRSTCCLARNRKKRMETRSMHRNLQSQPSTGVGAVTEGKPWLYLSRKVC